MKTVKLMRINRAVDGVLAKPSCLFRLGQPEFRFHPMLRVIFYAVWSFFTFVAWPVYAEIQVQAQITPQEIVVGESAQLVVQVSGQDEEVRDVIEPDVPAHPLWELTGGWRSEAMSSRLVKGPRGMEFKTQRSVQFQFEVYGLKAGEINIDGIQVKVAGQFYRSNPISLRILSPGAGGRRPAPPRPAVPPGGSGGLDDLDEMEQMFQQLLKRRGLPGWTPPPRVWDEEDQPGPPSPPLGPSGKLVVPPSKNDAFFIHLDIDKESAFVGEQVTAQWYLYTRGNILSLDRLKFPDLKGFWKEIIEEVPALNFTAEVIDGVMYRKALLAAHALFPIKAGTAVIDEYKIKATVQLPDRLGFGFGSPYSYQKSSPRIPIKVKELPKDGEPAHFTGAVGDFVVTVEGPEQSYWPVGQVFRLNFKFSGRGNAKFIELPEIQWPKSLQVVEVKSEAKFFKNGTSVKDVQVLLMPKKPGVVTWPQVSLWFFSPENQAYYEKTLEFPTMQFWGEALKENSPSLPVTANGELNTADTTSSPAQWSAQTVTSFWAYLFYWILVGLVMAVVFSLLIKLIRILFDWRRLQRRQLFWRSYWLYRLDAWQKALRKNNLSLADLAHQVQMSLSRLVGGMSRAGEDSLPFSRLLELTPPSFQKELGGQLKSFYAQLNQVAYAESSNQQIKKQVPQPGLGQNGSAQNGTVSPSFDHVTSKTLLAEASQMADRILSYLEPH